MADDEAMKAHGEKAALGDTLAACPRCGSFELHWSNQQAWRCPLCGHTFTEPAYYQRVPAPESETPTDAADPE